MKDLKEQIKQRMLSGDEINIDQFKKSFKGYDMKSINKMALHIGNQTYMFDYKHTNEVMNVDDLVNVLVPFNRENSNEVVKELWDEIMGFKRFVKENRIPL